MARLLFSWFSPPSLLAWLLALGFAAPASHAQTPTPPASRPAAPAPLDVADVAHHLYARLPAHGSLGPQRGHHVLLLVPVAGYSAASRK